METKKTNIYEAPEMEIVELAIEQAILQASGGNGTEGTGNESWL